MSDFLIVNEHHISIQHALNWHALFGGDEALLDFVVDLAVCADEAKARGYEASREEVQELFNEIRYLKRLESSDALRQWIADNHMDLEAIRTGCAMTILRRKLRDSISIEEIAGYYAEDKPSYERAEIYRICVDDEDLAQEIRAQVIDDGASFFLLALRHSTEAETAKVGGYVGEIGRKQVSGETEIAVFSSKPGDLAGPVKSDSGWHILLVHDLWTISPEDAAASIRAVLLDEIVQRGRKRAVITHEYAAKVSS